MTTSVSRSKMENLSLEMLQQICDHLDHRGLLDFSLVNSQCRSASNPRVFRKVCVRFSSPETLHASLDRWSGLLTSSGNLQRVHHLQVVARHLFPLHPRLVDFGDGPLDAWKYCAIAGSLSELVTDDADWQRLARLIRKLPALQELTWGCAEQIPPCVLRYLNEDLPRCRLHMRNFSLRSLVQPPDVPIHVDRYDLELATLPCLYSLAMRYDYLDSSGNANYNEHAIMDMVAGAAPHLREVSILWDSSGNSPELVRALKIPRQRWEPGLISSSSARPARGVLEKLELAKWLTVDSLRAWSETTDFSVLRSLKLHFYLTQVELRWLTDHCRFSSLDTLLVNLETEDDDYDSVAELTDAAENFILSLPPLRSLRMTGSCRQRTALVAIDHSGRNLRSFYFSFTGDQPVHDYGPGMTSFVRVGFLRSLRDKCPVLEELAICVLRSQGDTREVSMYRALGEIPSLRRIHLSVYISHPYTEDHWSWQATIEDPNGGLRHIMREPLTSEVDTALVDLAIDDTLAKSIFNTISSMKAPNGPSLECLALRVDALKPYGGFDSSYNLIKLLQYIGRSWVCTPSLRDDRPHHCLVEEYHSEEQLDREEMEESGELTDLVNVHFALALQRVWPRIPNGNWKDEWHSFPLAEVL